jgi:hypothetical protein
MLLNHGEITPFIHNSFEKNIDDTMIPLSIIRNVILMSNLRSTPNYTPLKYGCALKMSDRNRPVTLKEEIQMCWTGVERVNPLNFFQRLWSRARGEEADSFR